MGMIENLRKIADTIVYFFTIIIVLYGLTKGFEFTELVMNVVYFTVLFGSMTLKLISKE